MSGGVAVAAPVAFDIFNLFTNWNGSKTDIVGKVSDI